MAEVDQSVVVCKLPKAGLGNQLFPLMKAYVFAHLNQLPIRVMGYHQFKIGPYLRGEKSKRDYRNNFRFQKSIWGAWLETIQPNQRHLKVVNEPSLSDNAIARVGYVYVFEKIPHWNDYFKELKDHRQLVIELLDAIVTDQIKRQLNKLTAPLIGIHIRMGDFRKLKTNEDFSKVGTVRTPEAYFINVIKSIRLRYGSDLKVTIFTDGFKDDFKNLFTLKNIELTEGNSDLVDMLLLSKSKIIVTSAGSTFGYWAGFLSESPIIMHPDHIHESIRGNSFLYEGPVDRISQSSTNTFF